MTIEISAKQVMALRNKTGLSMMECKKALQETNGDDEAATDLLRKKMKGKMDTRTDRPNAEGAIHISISGQNAAIVEMRAETDFTAKNDKFQDMVKKVAAIVMKGPAGDWTVTPEMTPFIDELRISTGENVAFGRAHKVAGGPTTSFGSYVHHDQKTGVLLVVEGKIDSDVARSICMHITANPVRPLGVTAQDIPADMAARERKFRLEQAIESGKPQQIAEKMVEGGMAKFFSEVALLEQDYVVDPSKKIKDLVGGAKVKQFFRWQVGEQA